MNIRELRQLYESMGPRKTCEHLRDAIANKQLRPTDFSVRDLFEGLVENGREVLGIYRDHLSGVGLMEDLTNVSTTAFTNVLGQIVYSTVMDSFANPAFIGDQLCTVVDTKFSGEKIPGVSNIGDLAQTVREGEDYPTVGLTELYVETPETIKKGFIVPVTKEVILQDNTGLILRQASSAASALGLTREKAILDTVLGVTTSYKWKGVTADTYHDTHTTLDCTNFDNLAGSNALQDDSDIAAAELLFDAMTDPGTGEPLMVMPNTMVVPTAIWRTAMRLTQATQVKEVTNTNTSTYSPTVTTGRYTVLTSALVGSRSGSAAYWWIGDFKKAFAFMQNWGITTEQAGATSEAAFNRDVVAQFKGSYRGTPAVVEPRYVVKNA